jgi:hypothetical protein
LFDDDQTPVCAYLASSRRAPLPRQRSWQSEAVRWRLEPSTWTSHARRDKQMLVENRCKKCKKCKGLTQKSRTVRSRFSGLSSQNPFNSSCLSAKASSSSSQFRTVMGTLSSIHSGLISRAPCSCHGGCGPLCIKGNHLVWWSAMGALMSGGSAVRIVSHLRPGL